MNSNIITLESRNITSSENNNTWITTINKDIVIENGDVILMKNAYINIDQNSNSNINILEDTQITLEFGFYVINGIQNIYVSYDGNTMNPMAYMFNPVYYSNGDEILSPYIPLSNYIDTSNQFYHEDTDFGLYVLHNNDYQIIKNTKSFTIFKGSYSPTEIANIVTEHLNSINNQDLQNVINDQNLGPNLGTKLLYMTNREDIFIGQTYDNNSIMNQLKQFKLVNNYVALNKPDVLNENSQYIIGTNQFALDFNTDSQKFQFSFMHSPLYDNKGNISTWVGQTYWNNSTLQDGTTNQTTLSPLSQQTKSSGIFFTKLHPESFWVDKLGFDLNEMVVDVTNGLDIDNVRMKTTDNSQPLNAIQMSLTPANYQGWPIINTLNTLGDGTVAGIIYSFLSSNNIIPKSARGQYQTSNSGFYYIFCDLFFKNELLRNDNNNNNLSVNKLAGVISKFFLSSDYVTAFQDSSIMYQHSGEPYILSKINVSVYDSNMNDALLKKNSVIFFQVYKSSADVPTFKNQMVK